MDAAVVQHIAAQFAEQSLGNTTVEAFSGPAITAHKLKGFSCIALM